MAGAVLGVVAAVLTALFAWPQAFRAWRATSTEGLSLLGTTITFQSGLLWSSYGVVLPSPYILVANASVAAASLVTLVACRARLGPARLVAVVVAPVVMTTIFTWAGLVPTGLAGDVVAAGIAVPQAIIALRGRASLAAVSPASYVLLAVNAVLWIGYGVAIADPLVVAPNCVTLPASLIVLARRRAQQRTATG